MNLNKSRSRGTSMTRSSITPEEAVFAFAISNRTAAPARSRARWLGRISTLVAFAAGIMTACPTPAEAELYTVTVTSTFTAQSYSGESALDIPAGSVVVSATFDSSTLSTDGNGHLTTTTFVSSSVTGPGFNTTDLTLLGIYEPNGNWSTLDLTGVTLPTTTSPTTFTAGGETDLYLYNAIPATNQYHYMDNYATTSNLGYVDGFNMFYNNQNDASAVWTIQAGGPAVPEPASILMVATAGLSGLGYAWRRRKRMAAV